MPDVRVMLRCVRVAAVLAASLAAAPVFAAPDPAPAPGPAAKWTLMIYLDADNDLERPLMENLKEMAQVGSTADVNIIVLAARSPQGDGLYTNDDVLNLANWTTGKLLRVDKGKLTELADWGPIDMGKGAVLARFITTAIHDFPAQHYGLIFGDHGMAWAGVAVAETSRNESLGMVEIPQALQAATAATGPLDLVGFDACVMGSLEVAKAFAPFARYMVASEDVEPADGWNYVAVLTQLESSPAMDGAALGRIIVDSYHAFFAQSNEHERIEKAKALTLALVDLSKLPAVEQAVLAMGDTTNALLTTNALADKGRHDAWVRLADARRDAEEYGRSSEPSTQPRPGSEVYDLADVARHVKAQAHDPPSEAAADRVIAAIGQAVVYEKHGVGRPNAHGLSIFFPPDGKNLAMRGKTFYSETEFAKNNRWYPFLESYAKFPASEAERNRPKPVIDTLVLSGRMGGAGGKVSIVSQAHGDEIDEASFVVALRQNEDRIIIGSIPVDLDAADDLKEEWDGEWFSITDKNVELIAPITRFEELSESKDGDVYWADVPAQIKLAGTRTWLNVTLTFLLDFRGEDVSGDFIYAVQYSDYGPREIELDGGVDLRPVYNVINAAGEEHLTPSPDPAHVMHIDDVDDLKVGRSRMPAGDYQVGFVVQDLMGRNSESFVDVTLPEEAEK